MLARALAAIRRFEIALAVLLLAALVVVVFGGTVFRYAGAPQIWTEELAQALFAWLAMLAADITLQRAGHFRIDLATKWLPEPAQRGLDVLIHLMIAALLASLVWHGGALLAVAHPRPMPMLDVPSSLAAAALPVAFALMLVTTFEHALARIKGRKEDVAEARDVM